MGLSDAWLFQMLQPVDLSINFRITVLASFADFPTNSFFHLLTRALQAKIFTVKFPNLMPAPTTCSMLQDNYFIHDFSDVQQSSPNYVDSFLNIHISP